jgi:hypothetical protein
MLGVTAMARQTHDRNEQAHRSPTGLKALSTDRDEQDTTNKGPQRNHKTLPDVE